jgi:hypothetical protein
MNEDILNQLGRAIGAPDYPEAEPPWDVDPATPSPPPSAQQQSDAHYIELKRAVDALPWRLVIAIREAARLTGSVDEWAAVERAADAFVSARDK